MYHDVVRLAPRTRAGFPGRDAALYKVTQQRFEDHLAAAYGDPDPAPPALPPCTITFDDGGVSAMTAADTLERHAAHRPLLHHRELHRHARASSPASTCATCARAAT